MLAKKQNFLEKIVKRNYNNELEKLLEEKQFEENAKSTLLNIWSFICWMLIGCLHQNHDICKSFCMPHGVYITVRASLS